MSRILGFTFGGRSACVGTARIGSGPKPQQPGHATLSVARSPVPGRWRSTVRLWSSVMAFELLLLLLAGLQEHRPRLPLPQAGAPPPGEAAQVRVHPLAAPDAALHLDELIQASRSRDARTSGQNDRPRSP